MVGSGRQCRRAICALLMMTLGVSGTVALAQQQQAPTQQTPAPQTGAPGSVLTPLPTPIQGSNPSAPVVPQNRPQQSLPAPPPPPVGVAAAPVVRNNGVPASEPSGAAIAPAKQKRRFSVALRIGLIVGAAIAVGSVAAASLASPSKPHVAP